MDESKSPKTSDPKHPSARGRAHENKPTTDKPESFLKGPILEEQSSGVAAQGGVLHPPFLPPPRLSCAVWLKQLSVRSIAPPYTTPRVPSANVVQA